MIQTAKLTLIIALITAATWLAGCAASNDDPSTGSDLTIALDYPEPAAVGETTLLVTLTDASGEPAPDATVNVRGDMTHAGMQPEFGEVGESGDGVYTVPFEWTMGGDWVVTVEVETEEGETAEETFELTVDGPMEMGN